MADAKVTDTGVVEIAAFDAPLGAELRGLDLREKLSPEAVRAVLQAWYDNQVIVFRDQDLSPRHLVDFTAQLGTPGVPRMPSQAVRDVIPDLPPEVMIVSNVRIDGKPLGLPHDGEMWFHSDMCYAEIPHTATMLYSVELPSTGGGDTQFANTRMGYDALPEATKTRIADLKAEHSWEASRRNVGAEPPNEAQKLERPPVMHPMVRTHPDTGRKSLYLGHHISHVVDMDPLEGNKLLKELEDHTTQPDFVYT
ncbi:MAG: TauD/TfdA family dioxygenase, partial [Rhodospirillaceae bacterium]|nr:TauD/TfdA family dioxygenase [Rhodospirillaceae bacterium]